MSDDVNRIRYESLRTKRLENAEDRAAGIIAWAMELELVWAKKTTNPEKREWCLETAKKHRVRAERIIKQAWERYERGGWE